MTIVVNPMLGEAAVEIEGTSLMLAIDIAALLVMEQMTGRSFLETAAELLVTAERGLAPKIGTMQAIVYAATRARHPDLTAADCATLFLRHAKPLAEAVTAALVAALPEGKEPGKAKPPRKRRTRTSGTGTASSAAG